MVKSKNQNTKWISIYVSMCGQHLDAIAIGSEMGTVGVAADTISRRLECKVKKQSLAMTANNNMKEQEQRNKSQVCAARSEEHCCPLLLIK